MESILNYVAFNGLAAPQASLDFVFKGPGEALSFQPHASESAASTETRPSLRGAAAGKANEEAQMVLRGAIKLQRTDVAKHLLEQLAEANVEIFEGTYELMI